MPEKPAISVAALEDYLTFGFIAEPQTLFEGLCKLECGHSIVIKRGVDGIHFTDFSKNILHKNFDTITDYTEAKAHTETLLEKAVEKRLIADVPMGTLLSGGLDSGLITAMIAKKTDNITAFTASFNDKNLDEAEAAQALANHLGIKHSILKIDAIPESIIDDIAMIAGEPFADAAIMPLFLICNQAKSHVTVLLSGDGGDELFAGYNRYASFIQQENIKSMLSLKSRQFLLGKLAEIYPQSLKVPKFLRAGATLDALSTTTAGGYLRNIAIARPHIIESVLSEKIKQSRSIYRSVERLTPFFKHYYSDPQQVFNDARYCDIKYWLPARMLVKADRASMAASIELRCPLLDLDLTDYALKLPYKFLAHPSGGKKILRDIAQKYLPAKHLMRPKQGFVMNINHLLKNQWAARLEAVVNDTAFAQSNLLNMKTVKILMSEHFKGHNDHSRILWAIIQLEAYLRIHKFI
jgi:asparagine synthase (glutamine-hydrolysing)